MHCLSVTLLVVSSSWKPE
uniref:Uncharacterized protein n=1 Tax=Anguilla anguilla TaxID=7936 RepID=A0A0E9W0U3_ANGAN